MTSLMDRIRHFLRSPEGRKTADRARTMARDPRNRDKVRRFLDRFRTRR